MDERALAESLLAARDSQVFHQRPSERFPGLDLDTAYRVQRHYVDLLRARGETPRALKLGLTDFRAQREWGVSAPSYGVLTDRMILEEGIPLSLQSGISPRVEPEIAVVLAADLTEEPATLEEVQKAIASVHAGFEIVDPRYADDGFIPVDAVCDNSATCLAVWSPRGRAADSADWAAESVVVTIDGVEVARGTADIVMGNPLRAVAALAGEMRRRGDLLRRGTVVLTGNVVGQAFAVSAGQTVRAEFSTLGSLELDVVA